ncbi:glycosyltransferase family 4 protein [bacterium]|nr:glycosyltransferase family 4 protein [bacterium]
MNKTKILHIITNLPIGGAQDNTLLTVEYLPRERYEIHLLYGPEGRWLSRAHSISGIRCIEMPTLVRPIRLFKDVRALIAMTRLIRREKYDIVHTHSSKPGFLGRLAAKLAGTPVIVHTIHGFPFNDFMSKIKHDFFVNLERWASGLTDKLITVSELNRQKAIKLRLAPAQKFQTIYSGIQFASFDKPVDSEALRKNLNIAKHIKIIGFVGRLSPQKDPLCLVESMPEILRHHPESHFLIVGDGELRCDFEARAHQLNVSENICILGFREDVPQLLRVMDLFVLSSRWEGLGRSLTEALYCGLPCVATAVEGVPELITDSETGRLVPPQNPEALAQAVIDMLDDMNAAQIMAIAGQKRVRRLFDVRQMVRQIDLLYQAQLQEKGLL